MKKCFQDKDNSSSDSSQQSTTTTTTTTTTTSIHIVASAPLSVFESRSGEASLAAAGAGGSPKQNNRDTNGGFSWRAAMKRFVYSAGAMRRFQERLLGPSKTGVPISSSDIWFLGVRYSLSSSHGDASSSSGNSSGTDDSVKGLAAFEEDFSSRILMTYRKGFDAIGDSKYTSDVNWGCMLRSGQMLVAQALLFHRLGRSWRKPGIKLMDQDYIEILYLFGDTEVSPFSIHNLLRAGKSYDLAAGSWVGPYAMCRSFETLARSIREESDSDAKSFPMAVYIVSGDEDGERGGAPAVCIEDASRHCFEFSNGQLNWTPILLFVPLVLGLDKINPRYIPLLGATFTFPQSLGILGGKPGASTYIAGVQDDNAFYLDPHYLQPAVHIDKTSLEADTSSYHCSVIRHISLELIDPSLAIGFYCRDKDDFDDFCSRASKLADESDGAPLFTVVEIHKLPRPVVNHNDVLGDGEDESCGDAVHIHNNSEGPENEDEWQLL